MTLQNCPYCTEKMRFERFIWYWVAGCMAFIIISGTIIFSGNSERFDIMAGLLVLDFFFLFGGVYYLSKLMLAAEKGLNHSRDCPRNGSR